MISGVTMKINIDEYLMNALKEDITQEDVSTNAVMPEPKQGEVNLICKPDGIICGLEVFERVFKLLDDTVVFERKPLEDLSKYGKMHAYRHTGFWKPMDTLRDNVELNEMWDKGMAPWKVW